MKKIALLLLTGLFLCGLLGCANKSVRTAAIEYGNSEIFSVEEMDAAIKLIKKEFRSWEGCKPHNIRYSLDDNCNAENIEWMNELAAARGMKADFTQCIMFYSDFRSPVNGGGAWNPDSEYTNWSWWLARSGNGEWKLLTWGYA